MDQPNFRTIQIIFLLSIQDLSNQIWSDQIYSSMANQI